MSAKARVHRIKPARRLLSSTLLATAVVAGFVSPMLGATAAHAVGSYGNASLADKALTYVGGSGTAACADAHQGGGDQCKQFVNCIVYMVSGGSQWPVDPNGNYQQSYLDAGGVAVTAANAVKGDIIQEGTYDGDHLHTAIVVANNHNGSFDVVDSNYVAAGMVGHHTWTPPSGEVIGYYRMGTVIPAGFNVAIDANGAALTSGQKLSGTINLTAMASSQGIINSLTYSITGPNGYSTTINGGSGATNYAQSWNTAGLVPGSYSISVTANEIDDQNHTYPATPIPFTVVSRNRVDFNGDGKTDLLSIDGNGRTEVWLGNGNGTINQTPVVGGNGWDQLPNMVTGDFDGDGKTDIEATATTGNLYFYKGNGDGTFQNGAQVGFGWQGYTHLVTGDFFGDGKLGLAAISQDGYLHIYDGNGTGGFGTSYSYGPGWNVMSKLLAGDFNGDGKTDLLSIDGNGRTEVWLGNGNGTINQTPVVGGNGWDQLPNMVTGDFDGDGKTDIEATATTGNLYFYKGNGDGTFQNGAQVGFGWQGYTHLVTGDFFGDGKLGLAAISQDGYLHIYDGNGTGGFGTSYSYGPGWNVMSNLY
ncbi:VCBS repeat-containing protein [Kitasatospora sp. NPDC002227]|uniref:VCBS repeat-containing protein n=1 Tax=Kitasatospora sp. NPDC002227 TaxID=3154773 RepID=UPI00332C273F